MQSSETLTICSNSRIFLTLIARSPKGLKTITQPKTFNSHQSYTTQIDFLPLDDNIKIPHDTHNVKKRFQIFLTSKNRCSQESSKPPKIPGIHPYIHTTISKSRLTRTTSDPTIEWSQNLATRVRHQIPLEIIARSLTKLGIVIVGDIWLDLYDSD